MREKMGISQGVLALVFNCSVKTIRKWAINPDLQITGGFQVIANQLLRAGDLYSYLRLGESPTNQEDKLIKQGFNELYRALEPTKYSYFKVSDEARENARYALGIGQGKPAEIVAEKIEIETKLSVTSELIEELKDSGNIEAVAVVERYINEKILSSK